MAYRLDNEWGHDDPPEKPKKQEPAPTSDAFGSQQPAIRYYHGPSLLERMLINFQRDPKTSAFGLASIIVGIYAIHSNPAIMQNAEHLIPIMLGIINGIGHLFTSDSTHNK